MKHFLRLLISLFLLFGVQMQARCQEEDASGWDELLDRFERICKMCLTLKGEREAGADIPDSRLVPLLGELSALKDEIKDSGDRMPAAARRRYETIRRMYAAGSITDTASPAPLSPLPLFSLQPLASPASSLAGPVPPSSGAAPQPSYRWALSASALVVPEVSAGLRLDYIGSRIGAYAALRSSFTGRPADYDALSDGTASGTLLWTTGASQVDRFFFTAGPLVRIADRLYLSAGLGYGSRRLLWEDSEKRWALITDASRQGLCLEAGASLRLGRVMLGAGWLLLPQGYHAASLSLGLCFGKYYR